METLAPRATPSPPAAKDASPDASRGRVHATIYGADWCKPCHQAEHYLRSLGVDVVVKNIESSQAIRSELRAKLQEARLPPSSSIPIIDVSGQLMVGFNPRAVEQAVREARKRQR
jgi:glutaredoxin